VLKVTTGPRGVVLVRNRAGSKVNPAAAAVVIKLWAWT
jgi:hypothetical protein